MKTLRQFLAMLLTFVMLFTNGGIVALAEAMLTMPAELQIIDEEAFYGSTSIDKVVLSDKVTEIRARAFANSTLSEINLPDSLTFIAEDAFDGSNLSKVTVNENTYAWEWASEHGLLQIPVTSITLTAPETVNYSLKFEEITAMPKVSANIEPENVTNPSLTWSIEPTSVLDFAYDEDDYADEDVNPGDELHGGFRYIRPKNVGTATITATANDGSNVQGSITVQVVMKDAEPFSYPLWDMKANEQLQAETILEHELANGGIELGWDITTVRMLARANEHHSEIYGFLLDEEPDFNDPAQIERRVGDYLYHSNTTLQLALQAYINGDKIVFEKDTLAQGKYLRVMIGGYANDEATEPGWWTNYAWKIIPEEIPEPEELFIKSLTMDLETVHAGDTATWTAQAQNGSEPYKYQFALYKDDTRVKQSAYGSANTFSYTFTEAGTYHMVVRVRDSEYAVSEDYIGEEFTVIPPESGLKVTAAPDQESAYLYDTISWTAAAQGGVEPYRYSFKLFIDGNQSATQAYSTNNVFSVEANKAADYTLQVDVLDAENNSATFTTAPFTVMLRELRIESFYADPAEAQTEDTIHWYAQAAGGQDPYTYAYTLKKGSTTIDTKEASEAASYEYTALETGTYTLTVTTTDAAGHTATASANSVVSLRPVAVTGITAASETKMTGDPITWTAAAEGGDRDYTYAFTLYKDDEELDFRTFEEDNTFTFTPEEAGTYSVEVTVRDGARRSATLAGGEVTITIHPLEIVSLTADSDMVKVGNAVTLTTEAIGGQTPLRYSYEVYDANNTLITASTFNLSSTYAYTATASGKYTFKVKVRDAAATFAEATATSNPVTFYDPLTVTGISVSSSSALVGEAVTWTANVIGGKGNLEYIWNIYNGSIIEFTQRNTTGSLSYAPTTSGTYSAEVVVTDENGDTETKKGGSVDVAAHPATSTDDFTLTAIDGSFFTLKSYNGSDAVVVVPYEWTDENGTTRRLRTIADYAFRNNKSIVSVILPDGGNSWNITMGNYVFEGCTNLLYFKGGKELTNLGYNCFSGCTSLNNVDLPNTLTKIDYRAFNNCTALESIVLPDSITNLVGEAFTGCSKLSSVNYPMNWSTIEGFTYSPFVNCPRLTSIVVPEGVTKIPDHAFYGCGSLTKASLSATLQNIGNEAFRYCTGLQSLSLTGAIATIGNNAYSGCTGLTSVTFGNSVTTIGNYGFSGCTGLTSIVIPDNVKSLGDGVLNGCTGLVTADIGRGITVLSTYCFSGCTSLNNVDLPDTLTKIDYRAFNNCTALESIVLPDSVTNLVGEAFTGCSKLSSVNYPMNWSTIGGYQYSPFFNCPRLISIVVPEGVTKIPDHAFYGCGSLLKVYIPRSVTTVGNDAFYNHNSKLVIYGRSGSPIETWCTQNNITFKSDLSEWDLTTVTARVLQENDNALQGVTVSIYEDESQNYLCATTITDENGIWSWNEAMLGSTYWIHLSMDGYSFSSNDFSVYVRTEPTGAKTVRALYGGAPETILSLSENDWTAYSDGGMKLLTINTSSGWSVTESPDWTELYVQETVNNQPNTKSLRKSITYTADQELLISLGENTTGNTRNGQVIISNGDLNAAFNISQNSEEQTVGALNSVEFLTQSPYAVNESVSLHISASAFQQGVIVVTSDALQESSVTYFTLPEYDFTILAKQAGEYDVYVGVTTNPEGIQYEEYGLNQCTDYQNLSFTVLNESYDFGGMKPSDDLINFLISYDDFHSTHYEDSNGKPSIGYGHNYTFLSDFDEPISEELARQLLWGDVASKSRDVNSQMKKYGITLTQRQFDAFVSMAYNGIGDILYKGDRRLWNYYNEYGSFSAIPAEKVMESIITWHKCADKSKIFGLYRRRCDEAQIFIYGEYQRNYPPQPDWMVGVEPIWRSNGGYSYDVPDGWVSPLIETADFVRILSGESIELARVAATNQILKLSTSKAWTAAASESWIILNSSSGSQDAPLTYSVQANTGAAQRKGTITITSGSESSIFTITQHGTQSDAMSLTIDCNSTYNAGDNILAFVQVKGGSGNYRYSYTVYKYDGVTWTYAGSNALIAGTGRSNLIRLETLSAGSYKFVFQVRDYDGAIAENCAYVTVKQNSMNMVQPSSTGLVIPGTDSYKLEWTGVENADDYVLRIRDLTTGNLVIGNEAGDGVHTGLDTFFSISNVIALKQHVLRIWIGAYKNNVLIGQTQTIATAGPISAINYVSPTPGEDSYVEAENLTISWEPFSDGLNEVSLYRISVRDLTPTEQPLIVDNKNIPVSSLNPGSNIISYSIAASDGIVAGHEYRVWVGAFTQEGGRIAQKELKFHTTVTEVDNPYLVVDVGNNRDYTTRIVNEKVSEYESLLQQGQALIFMFEGCGDATTNKRANAVCVVVKMENGIPKIKYRNANSSTIPDNPLNAKLNYIGNKPINYAKANNWGPVPTVIDGDYEFTAVNHDGYASLNVSKPLVVRFDDADDEYDKWGAKYKGSWLTGVTNYKPVNEAGRGISEAINVHHRYTLTVTSSTRNSTGCLTISQSDTLDEYTEFLRAVGRISNTSEYTDKPVPSSYKGGRIIVDRVNAKNYIVNIYGSETAYKRIRGIERNDVSENNTKPSIILTNAEGSTYNWTEGNTQVDGKYPHRLGEKARIANDLKDSLEFNFRIRNATRINCELTDVSGNPVRIAVTEYNKTGNNLEPVSSIPDTRSITDTWWGLKLYFPPSVAPGVYVAKTTVFNDANESNSVTFTFSVKNAVAIEAEGNLKNAFNEIKNVTNGKYWNNQDGFSWVKIGTVYSDRAFLTKVSSISCSTAGHKDNHYIWKVVDPIPADYGKEKTTGNHYPEDESQALLRTGSQCYGYAEMIRYYIGGSGPKIGYEDDNGNSDFRLTDETMDMIEKLEPGDLIRFKTSGWHSAMVISVDADKVYVAQCNYSDPTDCVVSWSGSFSKSKMYNDNGKHCLGFVKKYGSLKWNH